MGVLGEACYERSPKSQRKNNCRYSCLTNLIILNNLHLRKTPTQLFLSECSKNFKGNYKTALDKTMPTEIKITEKAIQTVAGNMQNTSLSLLKVSLIPYHKQ